MGAVNIRCWTRRVMLVSAGAAMLAGCASADGEETTQARDPADGSGARVINVEVTPVALTSFVEYIRITGEVNALHDVTVSAEEAGAAVLLRQNLVVREDRQPGIEFGTLDGQQRTVEIDRPAQLAQVGSVPPGH